MPMLDNARAVVATWRSGVDETYWKAPAIGMPTSTLSRAYAAELQRLAIAFDEAADRLQLMGFLPPHTSVRDLRNEASRFAHRATRAFEWADALFAAEQEPQTST